MGVTNPFLVVSGWKAIEGWTETERIKGGPLRGLSGPTVSGGWRFFDFTFHRALSLTGPAMKGPVKPSQTQSNRYEVGGWE